MMLRSENEAQEMFEPGTFLCFLYKHIFVQTRRKSPLNERKVSRAWAGRDRLVDTALSFRIPSWDKVMSALGMLPPAFRVTEESQAHPAPAASQVTAVGNNH